jgi:hypothetical protein
MRILATIFTIAGLTLECLVVGMFDHQELANFTDVFKSPVGLVYFLGHLLACALFAFGAGNIVSKDGRRAALASSILYFTFAFTFPLVGMIGALAMIWMLKDRLQDEFIVGNTMIERWANRPHHKELDVHLIPLTASMRSLDRDGLAAMILGLRDLLPSESAHEILERYQQDLNSQVQFYAQSALSGELERVESHLSTLGSRVRENPENPVPRTALAEMLVNLANQRRITAVDREVHAQNALVHLQIALDHAPNYAYLHFLKARASLILRDTRIAEESLEKLVTLGAPPSMTGRVRAKLAFEKRDWDALTKMPPSTDPEISASLHYWQSTHG